MTHGHVFFQAMIVLGAVAVASVPLGMIAGILYHFAIRRRVQGNRGTCPCWLCEPVTRPSEYE